MKFTIKNYYFYILIFPLLLNFLYNIISQEKLTIQINIYEIISSLFLFAFFYSVGWNFKSIFESLSITFGIITYLLSFFIFENFINFIFNLNTSKVFIIVNGIWIILLLIKNKNKIFTFIPIIVFAILRIFNFINIESFKVNPNIFGDVKDNFFPYIEKINNFGFLEAILNPVMDGYPILMSYIDFIIYKISFNTSEYIFYTPNSFLFFWLNLLLISEFNVSKKSKNLGYLIFVILILNSSWLQFLFVTSLMSEKVMGYLFLGILNPLFKKNNLREYTILVFFIFGFMYFSKQFFSILTLISFILFLFNNQYKHYAPFILIGAIVKQIQSITYLRESIQDYHISQIKVSQIFLEIFNYKDLKFNNLIIIMKNLAIDKPMLYFLSVCLIIVLTNTIKQNLNLEAKFYLSLVSLNLFFIMILYVTVSKNSELESPIRFIYSFLLFYINLFLISIDQLNQKIKS